MQMPICAHGVTPVDADRTAPIGELSAALFENRDESRAIPRVHYGIEHDVGAARGDETMAVAIAPPSLERRRLLKRHPSGAKTAGQETAVRIHHSRFVEARCGGDASCSAIPDAAEAATGGNRVAQRGEMADTDLHHAINLQTQQYAEERHTVHEAACPVDRIDEPAVRRVSVIVAKLLANDAVRWESTRERVADQALRPTIRDRHRRAVVLQLDLQIALEVRENEAAGLLRQRDGEFQECASVLY